MDKVRGAFRVHFAERAEGGQISTNTAGYDVVAEDAVQAVTAAHKIAMEDKDLKDTNLVAEAVDLHAWLDS